MHNNEENPIDFYPVDFYGPVKIDPRTNRIPALRFIRTVIYDRFSFCPSFKSAKDFLDNIVKQMDGQSEQDEMGNTETSYKPYVWDKIRVMRFIRKQYDPHSSLADIKAVIDQYEQQHMVESHAALATAKVYVAKMTTDGLNKAEIAKALGLID